MELALKRKWLTPRSTIGELSIDGVFECFVLEDRYRPPPEVKVSRETCIPCGRYEVQVTYSPRFQRPLPLLLDVPGFSGVRIHPGNKASDTEGCLLPGLQRGADTVLQSKLAFDGLFLRLRAAAGPVFITITV